MPEGKHPDHHHAETGPVEPHEQQIPYWKRAHKDWKFWVGVVLIFAAIAIYVLSLDLSTVAPPTPRSYSTGPGAPSVRAFCGRVG